MAMPQPSITFLGQSGFLLEYQGSILLIDPQNKAAGARPGNIVYGTHQHFDHIGGVNHFLEQNPDALLIGNPQVAAKFAHWGDRVTTVNAGDTLVHKPWTFQFIQEPHGFFKNKINLGIIVRTKNFAFGHVGDAVRFQGFATAHLDVIAVPIVGGFTASPKRAVNELAKFDEPLPIIVPMHWMYRSPKRFCKRLKKQLPQARCIKPEKNAVLQL
jgi:L-ascorbate metabolism protein UlaG (beta-lactamase superfamily)